MIIKGIKGKAELENIREGPIVCFSVFNINIFRLGICIWLHESVRKNENSPPAQRVPGCGKEGEGIRKGNLFCPVLPSH